MGFPTTCPNPECGVSFVDGYAYEFGHASQTVWLDADGDVEDGKDTEWHEGLYLTCPECGTVVYPVGHEPEPDPLATLRAQAHDLVSTLQDADWKIDPDDLPPELGPVVTFVEQLAAEHFKATVEQRRSIAERVDAGDLGVGALLTEEAQAEREANNRMLCPECGAPLSLFVGPMVAKCGACGWSGPWSIEIAEEPRPFEDCDLPCGVECDRTTCDRDEEG